MGSQEDAAASDLLLRAKNVELAAIKVFLMSIVEGISDSLVIVDFESKIKLVNRATLDLLGYTEEDMIRKPVELLFREAGWREGEPFCGLLKAGPLKDRRISYWTKTNAEIPVMLSASVLRDNQGRPTDYICIARDIRETLRLRRQERDLQLSEMERNRLDELVRQRTQNLEKTLQDLKQAQAQLLQSEKLRAVGQLAAGVAHEINNPIAIILGFAQSAARGIDGSSSLALPLRSIEREAVRCKELVQNLLAFSRSSGPERREETDLNACVRQALALVLTQTKIKEIEVIQELDAEPLGLTANNSQVQQVIINLCSNAIDAMPKGGRLTIRTGHASRNGGVTATLEIADTGMGIPKDLQSRIFEPFFTTKEVGKGTGLGLALVHEIVKKHGGDIDFSSEKGKGTAFLISFPASAKKLAAP